MYVCMYACKYIRMYVRMYVCMHVCMHVNSMNQQNKEEKHAVNQVKFEFGSFHSYCNRFQHIYRFNNIISANSLGHSLCVHDNPS